MTFNESVATCINKYGSATGRASRSEYWWFILFCNLVDGAAKIVDVFVFPQYPPILEVIVGLALLLPNTAVMIRRLHDVGRSGRWILIAVTGVGLIVLIYWTITRGEKGGNRFGPAVV